MDENLFHAAHIPSTIAVSPAPVWSQVRPYGPYQEYAGFWRRFLASLIDGIVLTIPVLVSQNLVGRLFDELAADRFDDRHWWLAILLWFAAYFAITLIINWLYFAGLESSAQQATLGKRALGIVVTDLAGERISFGRATGRFFAHYVTFLTLFIGDLIQPFTARRQALHDLIAGTLVVRT